MQAQPRVSVCTCKPRFRNPPTIARDAPRLPICDRRQMASLWADSTWHAGAIAGLGFGVGVRYQSLVAGAADNPIAVPSDTR
ncbi:hypothetical protein E1N52_42115 [Paraburkholderia guartelaensis]|uniref:Uncharacterized protein n=1 Tax=Paraburkholderia guartelaensis TaxID=2546446 RepID=A0A4R5L3E2_9BURK|nr:hypothetical protein E1N52_42115 [Paraburkholderia guartelaensis]